MASKKVSVTADDLYGNRELYFKTCLKIVPKNASGMIPLTLKKEQQRLAKIIDSERQAGRGPRIVVLKSRRIGASTFAEAELFKECHLKPLKQALVVAHKAESAQTIFDMSKRFYDHLPEGMKPPTKYSTKRLIHFDHNDSKMQVEVAGESRGFTAQYLHISELAFMDEAETLMTAILSTVGDDPNTLVIAESTPNGIGNYFHNLWVNAKAGRNSWVPFFSPWYEDETYRMAPWFEEKDLSPDDLKRMHDHGLSLEQMAWYMNVRQNNFLGDQDKMDQEFATDDRSCFLASGRKVFDTEGLKHYTECFDKTVADLEIPDDCEIDPNPADKKAPTVRKVQRGRWKIYREPQPRHLYVVGVDPASGDPGGDWTPIVVLNQHTLGIDAVGRLRVPPEILAKQVEQISWWYNTAKVAGEANNHGLLFFDELIRRLKYPNIYYRKVSEESVSWKIGDKPGVWMSGANREGLFNLVRRYVREKSGVCVDSEIIREWQELYYDDTNRVDHPKGGSSDFTAAMAMALYVHSGSLDATLQPLDPDVVKNVTKAYRESVVKKSMGIPHDDVDLAGLTMDEIQKLDDMTQARDKARKKFGIGGYR